jgi:peptidoglycan/LPS O-acetylase OafA/YrhL
VTLLLGALWPRVAYTFPVWLLGSFLYFGDRKAGHSSGKARINPLATLGLGLVLLAGAVAFGRLGGVKVPINDLLVGSAFAVVLWGLLRGALPFPSWLDALARYGAGASFSLYATHIPLFAFLLAIIGHDAARKPDAVGYAMIALLCLTAVTVAWLFSRVTEANTSRVRRLIKLHLPAKPAFASGD